MLFLITGAAGFIGYHLAERLLQAGHRVIGVDNLNAYYAPSLKQARLDRLTPHAAFSFQALDITDHDRMARLVADHEVDRVIHLAAQAGVRHSIDAPFAYAQSNIVGHLSVLEACRHAPRRPMLVYASSSSVYGSQTEGPFRESDRLAAPASLYAATKQADELLSASYAQLYGLQQIGVRFFTVYGPWGRPDMAYWLFTDRILRGEPIRVFNEGRLQRDFTYIADAIDALSAVATGEPRFKGLHPHRLYNIGHNRPVELMDFIVAIEEITGQQAKLDLQPMQAGDVPMTCADITRIGEDYGYVPRIELREGLRAFVTWYQQYQAGVTGTADATADSGTLKH
jgi:UDP-glucuronate 4-epimerase